MKKIEIIILFIVLAINLLGQEVVIERIDATEFATQILDYQNDEISFTLIDVRTKGEFDASHIDGAINIDYYKSNFFSKLNELKRDDIYLIYCRSGNRSGKAASTMQAMGYKNVYNLDKGIKDWKKQNMTLVK